MPHNLLILAKFLGWEGRRHRLTWMKSINPAQMLASLVQLPYILMIEMPKLNQKPFPLEWKVVRWSLILSGGCGHYQSLMLECNCTTMALINRACSWVLYLPSLTASSHLRSLHCKLTLQARSSHGWRSFKYLTKCHPL